uniref:nitrous oxide-stimulated promoter family protein n=1 Tax=Faecalibacterium prausnitzii TaxID=853 RepID=UPI003FEE062B
MRKRRSKPLPSWYGRYCRGVHGTRDGALCPACAVLLEYARQRRDGCPHGEIDSRE